MDGTSSDDEVLQWIQARITCRIPEENSNPELHQLVTKYQHHKCNSYCQRKKWVGDTFITRCRFGFPRQECSTATLLSVDECMKLSHRKMYTLPRSPVELTTRIHCFSCCGRPTWTCSLLVSPCWSLPTMSPGT